MTQESSCKAHKRYGVVEFCCERSRGKKISPVRAAVLGNNALPEPVGPPREAAFAGCGVDVSVVLELLAVEVRVAKDNGVSMDDCNECLQREWEGDRTD